MDGYKILGIGTANVLMYVVVSLIGGVILYAILDNRDYNAPPSFDKETWAWSSWFVGGIIQVASVLYCILT